ncbi:MAG: aspartyl/asparaginyl beta-hydroxylase domain-containing protein [Planctomycetaceae bacterium]
MKVQLPFEFNAERLLADLNKVHDEDWIAHYNPGDYEGSWQIAALMSPAGSQTNIWSCSIPEICSPTPLLNRCEYFQSVLSQIPVTKSSVRLMKLDAGAIIKEHSDSFGDNEIRIHIPVTTNPEVEFALAGERVEMAAGSCWFLDFRLPHSVVNHGTGSRTHLVIDAYRNDWFNEQLGLAKKS